MLGGKYIQIGPQNHWYQSFNSILWREKIDFQKGRVRSKKFNFLHVVMSLHQVRGTIGFAFTRPFQWHLDGTFWSIILLERSSTVKSCLFKQLGSKSRNRSKSPVLRSSHLQSCPGTMGNHLEAQKNKQLSIENLWELLKFWTFPVREIVKEENCALFWKISLIQLGRYHPMLVIWAASHYGAVAPPFVSTSILCGSLRSPNFLIQLAVSHYGAVAPPFVSTFILCASLRSRLVIWKSLTTELSLLRS